jgi:ketosteroid isomerase-like protein
MKKYFCIVPLVLVFCFSFACQDKAAMAELAKFKAQAKVEEQNAALVRTVFDELNNKNADVYPKMYAPEYRWYFPSANPKGLSREEESGFVKLLWAGFPDCHWDVEEMVVHGDRVIVRFVFKGTHAGEFQGLLPTGNKTEAGGIWMGRVKDEKIVESREEDDLLGWMQQMGMELKPKEVKK